MKERTALPRRDAQAEGNVTIQYTDAVTGKVLEEIKGKNHVFTAQLAATAGFQSTALKADLLLCEGGSQPEEDMPFIPGSPIGYGRPGAEGTGLYRGTYRTADSWFGRTTRGGVSSKYVYDVLPTQALGKVDWVGLTAAMGTGVSVPSYQPPFMGFSGISRACDCENGVVYRAAVALENSYYRLKFYRQDCFSDAEEQVVDLTELAGLTAYRSGTAYPRTTRIFLDVSGGAAYVMSRGTPLGVTTAVYKVLKVALDGSQVLGQWDITTGTEYVYEVTYPGGARDGKLWWMVPSSDYRGYSRYVCDVESGAITKTEIALEDSNCNLLRWEGSVAYVYGNCFWYSRRDYYGPANDSSDYKNYFLYGSPLFDMANQAVHGLMPPSPMEASGAEYSVWPSPIAAVAGQWIKTCYVSADILSMPFAYTCYAVPSDTPERPEGSGMTVTYELDISW